MSFAELATLTVSPDIIPEPDYPVVYWENRKDNRPAADFPPQTGFFWTRPTAGQDAPPEPWHLLTNYWSDSDDDAVYAVQQLRIAVVYLPPARWFVDEIDSFGERRAIELARGERRQGAYSRQEVLAFVAGLEGLEGLTMLSFRASKAARWNECLRVLKNQVWPAACHAARQRIPLHYIWLPLGPQMTGSKAVLTEVGKGETSRINLFATAYPAGNAADWVNEFAVSRDLAAAGNRLALAAREWQQHPPALPANDNAPPARNTPVLVEDVDDIPF